MMDCYFLLFVRLQVHMYLHESGPVCLLMPKIFCVGSAVNNRNCSAHSPSIPFVPEPAGI